MKTQVNGQINIFGEVENTQACSKPAGYTEPVLKSVRITVVRVTAVEDGYWNYYEYPVRTLREAAARYKASHPLGIIKGLRYTSKVSVSSLAGLTETF